MTTQPNEALVEEVARALCHIGGCNKAYSCEWQCLWKEHRDAARAIIPIVQKAVEGEIVAWLRDTRPSFDIYVCKRVADAIERGEHRKSAL